MSLPEAKDERRQYEDRIKLTLEELSHLENDETILIKAFIPKFVHTSDTEDYFFSLIKNLGRTVDWPIYESMGSGSIDEKGNRFLDIILSAKEEVPQAEDVTKTTWASYKKRSSMWGPTDRVIARAGKRSEGAKRRHRDSIKEGQNVRIRLQAHAAVELMAEEDNKTIGIFLSDLVMAEAAKRAEKRDGTKS